MKDENGNNIDDNLENKRYEAQLERDTKRWTVRRRLAVFSFIALLSFGAYYAGVGIFVSEIQAKAISEFNGIVVAIIGALTSILLGYYGTAYLDDASHKPDEYNNDK